jgi:glutaredoxin 3
MRCSRHGLAVGQDGQCVLCRREAHSLPPAVAAMPAATSSWVGPNLLLAAMVAVVTAGLLGSRAVAGLGPVAPPALPSADGDGAALPGDNDIADLDEAEYRAALGRVEIYVYYAPWCPACKAARGWLRARQIPYTGFNVQRDPGAARRLRDLNPRGSIPTIEVDGKVVVGFDERKLSSMINAAVAKRHNDL